MAELRYDEEATKQLLAVYVTPDVVAQREQFLLALAPQAGERVLDVGSGPGFLAAAMAEAVGSSGMVHGIDISEPLLAVARAHCVHQPWVEFHKADATQLPMGDQVYDAVIAIQVLEYIRDVDAALTEICRVTRRAGRVIIVDTDWDSIVWHSPNRERMNRVLAAWDQHAAHPYLPRAMANKLRRVGLRVESMTIMPLFNAEYDPITYSNRVIDLIARFVTDCNAITRDEAEAWARELRESGARGEYFFSLNRYLFVATKN